MVSVLELIARNIVTTLGEVRKQNGYSNDLTVRRFGRSPLAVVDRLTVVRQDDSTIIDGAHNHREQIQPFIIQCMVIVSENDDDPLDTHLNSVRADIEKALMVDPHRGTDAAGTRLALDTMIEPAEILEPEIDGFDGVRIVVNVQYRHPIGDPYTVA